MKHTFAKIIKYLEEYYSYRAQQYLKNQNWM